MRGGTAVAVLATLVAGFGLGATPAKADTGCTVQIVAHPDDLVRRRMNNL